VAVTGPEPPRVVPLLAVAHGSADPAAARANRALLTRTGLPWHLAFLDHEGPRPAEVLDALADSGAEEVVVLPLLLAHAGHARDDVGAVDSTRLRVLHSRALAPHPLLVEAAAARLDEAGVPTSAALVLASAGTRDAAANAVVSAAAAALVERGRVVAAAAGFASLTTPAPAAAAAQLRAAGYDELAVLPWFLAPGRLPRAAVDAVGARWPARPLADHPLVAAVVRARYDEVLAASTGGLSGRPAG